MSTLRICLFVAVVMAISLTIASADALNGGYKQTDFPVLNSFVQVIDPANQQPLEVAGPDGTKILCPANQVPDGAIVRVYWIPNAGSRHTMRLKNREKDGVNEPDIVGGPYVVDYDSGKDYLGPHAAKAVMITDEGRWDPRQVAWNVIGMDVDTARYREMRVTPVETPDAQPQLESVLLALNYRGRTIEMQVLVDTMQLKYHGIVNFYRAGMATPVAKARIDNVVYHRAVEATITEGTLANGDAVWF